MSKSQPLTRHPLLWVPSLYLAMGIPFNMIMSGTAASSMYKSLGYSDGQITIALGSVGVAWSLKPLWAAFLDMYRTKRFFVLSMEVLIAVLLVGVAMSLPASGFFQISIAIFWTMAFASSTQDICADGIYLTALDKPAQARMAGVQSFWTLGKVLAAGLLIAFMDRLRLAHGWNYERMWQGVMVSAALMMLVLAAYHFFMLPSGSVPDRSQGTRKAMDDFLGTAVSFFHKRMFWGMIAFVFLYRLGEGLLLIEGALFLQSPVSSGGLGLTPGQVSSIDAVWGTIFLSVGGLLGGLFASRLGLARSLAILGVCLNVPHITYVYLSHLAAEGHGVSYATIATLVSIEKFGYGFGFIGNMIYMMQQLAPGRCTMTHYAFASALMNLVLVPTNMLSGPLAELLGFSTFFVVVMFASVPSIWVAWKAPFPLSTEDPLPSAKEASPPHGTITVDDPTRLTPDERKVQVVAGRASIYAMLNILVILIVDAKILGSLQGREPGAGRIQVGLLLASTGLKLFLAWRTFAFAREASTEAARAGESVYLKNARGAKIATVICGSVSVIVLGVAVKLVFG